MTKRAGYSLVEMVLAIGALSVVLGLCVASIRGLITLDRANRARLNEGVVLDRLGRQFRQDVRAARSARAVDDPGKTDRLELQLPPSGVVEYHWDGSRVVRVERSPGTSDRRETYRLPNRKPPKFQASGAAGQMWVSLVIERKAGPASLEPEHEFRAEAWVGRDLRWTQDRSQSR